MTFAFKGRGGRTFPAKGKPKQLELEDTIPKDMRIAWFSFGCFANGFWYKIMPTHCALHEKPIKQYLSFNEYYELMEAQGKA